MGDDVHHVKIISMRNLPEMIGMEKMFPGTAIDKSKHVEFQYNTDKAAVKKEVTPTTVHPDGQIVVPDSNLDGEIVNEIIHTFEGKLGRKCNPVSRSKTELAIATDIFDGHESNAFVWIKGLSVTAYAKANLEANTKQGEAFFSTYV